jgi:hypothetical protein
MANLYSICAESQPNDPLVVLLQQVVARLVSNFERLRVVNVELARRAIIKDLVAGGRSQWWSKRMQKLRAGLVSQQQQQQQRDEWKQAFRMCPRDLQQQLEASFIADVSVAKAHAEALKGAWATLVPGNCKSSMQCACNCLWPPHLEGLQPPCHTYRLTHSHACACLCCMWYDHSRFLCMFVLVRLHRQRWCSPP